MIHGFMMHMVCPFLGTMGYAVLFNVPRRFYLSCGFTGMAGWLVYHVIVTHTFSAAFASFLGNVRGILAPGAEHPEEMPDYDLSGCRYPAVSAGSGDLPYRILSGDKPVGGGVPAGNGVGQGSVCHCPWDCIHAGCPGESVSDGVRLPACAFQKGYEEKRNLGAGRQGAFQMKRNVRKG